MPSSSPKQHRFMEAVAHNKAFAKKAGIPQSVGEEFSKADKGKFKQGGIMKHSKSGGLSSKIRNEDEEIHRVKAERAFDEAEKHGMRHGGKVKKMAPGGAAMNPRLAAMIAAGAARGGARGPMRPPMAAMARPAVPMGAPMGAPMAAPGMKHGGLSKAHHKHLAEHHLSMAEHHMHMHEGGHMKKMAKGGSTGMGPRTMSEDVEKGSNKHLKHGESAVQKRGHTKGMEPKMNVKGLNDIGTEGMRRGGHVKKYAKGGHIGEAHRRGDGIAQRGHTKTTMYKHGGKC